MKKIKIAFAALTAVAGIGGAYAATHQESANRANTVYRWHTLGSNASVIATTTVPSAQILGNCFGSVRNCLRGTVKTALGNIHTLFIQKP